MFTAIEGDRVGRREARKKRACGDHGRSGLEWLAVVLCIVVARHCDHIVSTWGSGREMGWFGWPRFRNWVIEGQ